MNLTPEQAAQAAAVAERTEGERAPSWVPREHPEQPRTIAGVVLERRVRPGKGHKGADAETLLIRTAEQDWLLWIFGAVLINELAGVWPGDVVAVKYEGHRAGGQGANGYELFRVSVDQAPRDRTAPLPAPVVDASDPFLGPELAERDYEPAPIEPAPAAVETCATCGYANGRHAPGCPAKPQLPACEECGFFAGNHAAGCSSDIPF